MTKFMYNEMKGLLCGEKIGSGIARTVYACRQDPACVVKIERGYQSFQNIAEWEMWQWCRGTPKEKWLAPCLSISAAGTLLLQCRVTPMRGRERPKKIPAFLTDIKVENFGILDGRVVCIDYGTVLHNISKASDRMVKVVWK